MPHHQELNWSTTLPAGWSVSHDEETALFRRHDQGVGTLAITLLCDEESITREKIEELAATTLGEGYEGEDVDVANYSGLYFSYHEDESAWREWYLAAGKCLFFITYDCPRGSEQQEVGEVEEIIAALRVTS